MMITIENTPELVHANGLPVRVWAGTTAGGNPVMALVTRLMSPSAAGTAELEAALSEPPTAVVDPSGTFVAAPRACTVCNGRGLVGKPARYVARDDEGLEWFECGEHESTDNVAETRRTALEPIGDWFARHALPLPGGPVAAAVALSPDPERELGRLRDRLSTIVDEAFGVQPVSTFDELLDVLEREQSAERIRRVNQRAELERECRSLRERLAERAAPSWLTRDFWALYTAADASLKFVTIAESTESRAWLELQLARMRPAFDVCEAERLGAPDRLTAAERKALDAVHRWLHSPTGDCMLIDAAEDFHEQIGGDASECERLEAEETRAAAIIAAELDRVDGALLELDRVAREAAAERASQLPAAETPAAGVVAPGGES